MTPLAHRLESSLLPIPDTWNWENGGITKSQWTTTQKIRYCTIQALTFAAGVALIPFAAAYSLGSRLLEMLSISPEKIEKKTLYLADLASALPADFGFADSLFQSSGLGTSLSPTELKGKSNWEKWLTKEHIEGSENYREFFIDILKDPRPFIELLKAMNVTAHRFSLEWAVIEPEQGKIDNKAVELYRNFIQELKNAKIKPYVTLHHFVLPDWFGDFEQLRNGDLFVEHALWMIDLFPEVTNWMTFNEPAVYAFQSRIRGVYPPGVKGDLQAAAQVLRNLLIAHCRIYKKAKEKFGDRIQIGITHQWLKFEPLGGNFLEKTVCYFLSKITHYSVYNFFKTGRFDLEIPTKTNIHFHVSERDFEENNRFLDFIGVQFYGYPRLKIGFNGGEEHPGYQITNIPIGNTGLTFGATCPKGGKTQSFGPSFYPESLEPCLTEATDLKKPIAITETGCDAKIQKWGEKEFKLDDETQKEYFLKITPILAKFKGQIKAFFIWTLYRGHLEWDRGDGPALGIAKLTKDSNRNLISAELSTSGELLQKVYGERKHLLEKLTVAA